jgi:hypothetical protein
LSRTTGKNKTEPRTTYVTSKQLSKLLAPSGNQNNILLLQNNSNSLKNITRLTIKALKLIPETSYGVLFIASLA